MSILTNSLSSRKFHITRDELLDKQGNVCCPKNTLSFNQEEFLRLLTQSFSLTPEEKIGSLNLLSSLTQTQLDQFIKVLQEEEHRLINLYEKEQTYFTQLQKSKEQEFINSVMQLS